MESSVSQWTMPAPLLGALLGFALSIPGGPVNLTLLGEGGRRGFRWSFFVGLGAVAMEAVYCWMALAGSAQLFSREAVRVSMELVSIAAMAWIGTKYLLGRPIPGEARGIRMVEHRFHPHSAFWTGFARVLGNPGVLLLWLAVAGTMTGPLQLSPHSVDRWMFVGGVMLGGLGWFVLFAWGISAGSRRFSDAGLHRLTRWSGALLLVAAAGVLVKLFLAWRRVAP